MAASFESKHELKSEREASCNSDVKLTAVVNICNFSDEAICRALYFCQQNTITIT